MPHHQRLLISLVSDQRMQNVLPVFQRGLDFDRVLLVASAQDGAINLRYQHIAADLTHTLENHVAVVLHPKPVDPYDPESTRSVLGSILAQLGADTEAIVNFTGGTKPMAVGAYLAAKDYGLPQLYVDTFNERFLLYEPSAVMRPINFHLQGISIPLYLKAHHRNIHQEQTAQHRFRAEELSIASVISRLGDEGIRVADALHTKTFQKGSLRIKIPRLLREALANAGFVSRWDLTQDGEQYFRSGRWLEAFAYQSLQEANRFDDIRGPVIFESPSRRDDPTNVTNEIDVMVLYQGKLGLIECKTRLRRRERSGGQTGGAQDALGKLKALQDVSAGLFGKGFVVTAQREKRLSPAVYERAREYRLTIIPRESLLSLPDIVYRGLSSRR